MCLIFPSPEFQQKIELQAGVIKTRDFSLLNQEATESGAGKCQILQAQAAVSPVLPNSLHLC
jgi:16S rRNA U1498 N3-methylase RsmE